MQVKKYVDDVSGMERIHSSHLYNSKISDGLECRYIHATQAQNLFDVVREGASEKGMMLNSEKTVLLCFSAATSYKPKTFINVENDIILSSKKCRLLGFISMSHPGWGLM